MLVSVSGDAIDALDRLGTTALKAAFSAPANEELKRIVFHEGSSRARANSGEAAVDAASAEPVRGDSRLVQLLLDAGADPNVSDDDGAYPLHWVLQGSTYEARIWG